MPPNRAPGFFHSAHRDARGDCYDFRRYVPCGTVKFICLQLSFSLSYVLSQKLVPRQDAAGRILVMEVLKNLPSIGNLIRTGNWQQVYSYGDTIEGGYAYDGAAFALSS